MKSEFDKWVEGELVWDQWGEKLVPITPIIKADMAGRYPRYLTYDQFNDWDYIPQETFEHNYTTPNGEQIVGFGYYGYDG
jgi:hypothetical protein